MFWGSGVVFWAFFSLTVPSPKPLTTWMKSLKQPKKLAHPQTPDPASPPLESIQDELNIVREGALRSAMYAKEAEQRKNDLIVYISPII